MKRTFFLFLMIFLIMLVLSSPVLCQFNYYIRDHLGSTRVVLDENGNTKEYYDYEPFGLSLRENVVGSEQARYKFTGKELDDRDGLNWYDFGARYYDPEIGRWLSPDPLAEKYPGLSPYVYAANNPLRFVDPNGEDITSTFEEDEKGNKRYIITYTATLINESSQNLTSDQLTNVAERISKQIESSFTGLCITGEGKKITWEAKADIVVSDKPREGDNIIKIADMDNLGESQMLGNIQKISADLASSGSNFQIGRSGAHEFGHGAGLDHPFDPNTGIEYIIDLGNLMQQSRYSWGTFIGVDQIIKLHQMVNFWYGSRRK